MAAHDVAGVPIRNASIPARSWARREALRLIKRLRKYGAGDSRLTSLADQLVACRRQRCGSAACPMCARSFQRRFILDAMHVLTGLEEPLSILSLVPADSTVPVGNLGANDLRSAKERVTAGLKGVGITTALGGIDVSANEGVIGSPEPYWQPHAWVLVPSRELNRCVTELRRLFSRSAAVPRPVMVRPWDGHPAALAYAVKPNFVRRVSYQRAATAAHEACWDTRDRPLRIKQQVELAVAMNDAGFSVRLLMVGITYEP